MIRYTPTPEQCSFCQNNCFLKYNKQFQPTKTHLPKTDYSAPPPFQTSAFALRLMPSKIPSATCAGNPAVMSVAHYHSPPLRSVLLGFRTSSRPSAESSLKRLAILEPSGLFSSADIVLGQSFFCSFRNIPALSPILPTSIGCLRIIGRNFIQSGKLDKVMSFAPDIDGFAEEQAPP